MTMSVAPDTAPKVTSAKAALASYRDPSVFFRSLSAAAVLAVLNVATAVSIGTLVFSGALSAFVPLGIGLFLLATAVSGLLIPATSGYKALMAGPRAGQSPIFAAMAATIALSMQGQPPETIAVTVVAAILVTTVIVGAFMFIIGLVRLGTLARFIPFPVMGGFLAGLGYLLTKGGVSIAIGPVATGDSLFTEEVIVHLLPALMFGLALFLLEQRIKHWLLIPTFLACAIGLFYLILFATGTSLSAATQLGWLSEFDVGNTSFFPVLTPSQLPLVDWTVISQQAGTIVVLCILSVIMLLLDVSGVEILINRDLDPNRELRSAGLSNVVGGLGTSPLGFGAAADTAVARSLGGERFLMIILYTVFIVGVMLIGPAPIGFVPPAIVGGFLIYIGLSFLVDWVWTKRSKLPFADTLVICIILATIAAYGILEGVAVGVVLATVLFVHKYSQISVIKSAMNGAEHVSNIDRHKDEQAFLDQQGHRVYLFVLQGFLFFGSASQFLEEIKKFVDAGDKSQTRYIVIDFQRVDEMDSSAANSFTKLMQICAREGIVLCLTGDNEKVIDRLRALAKGLGLRDDQLRFFGSLEIAGGWCDDQLLETAGRVSMSSQIMAADALLADLLGETGKVSVLSTYFEKVEFKSGEVLFNQGEPGDSLYLILGGSISIVLQLPHGKTLTVRTMRAGSILGEMSVYTGSPRSASAVVREDSVLYRLSTESYRKLLDQDPNEAGAFSACIVRLLAERLGRANTEVLALTR